MKIIPIEAGDCLLLKKPHPCKTAEFTVLRTGSDVRIRCNGCGRDLIVPRIKLEKSIRQVNGHSLSALNASDA